MPNNNVRYERQLAYINQEMEAECVEMQEDAPEIFPDNCCGRSVLSSKSNYIKPKVQVPEVCVGPGGAPGVLLRCQPCLLHLDDVRHRLHHRDGSQHHAGAQGVGLISL